METETLLDDLGRRAARDPALAEAVALAGEAQKLLGEGDLRGFLDRIDRALSLRPEGWLYLLRFRALRDRALSGAAYADLERAIEASPKDAALREEYGDILFRSKDYGRAADRFTQALARRPDDPVRVLAKRAEALWSTEKPAAALADLKRCLKLAPERDDLRLRLALIALYRGDARGVSSSLARWRRSRRDGHAERAAFIEGAQAFSAGRFAAAARFFARAEDGSRGRYFQNEFPRLRYSNMAKALDFLS